ncbi:hypothetical protein HUJ04_004439 [Dendroctonus ponderosae]|nr:hypothetical protein HUJ04_004439 [Dendroctonus ponderosae]
MVKIGQLLTILVILVTVFATGLASPAPQRINFEVGQKHIPIIGIATGRVELAVTGATTCLLGPQDQETMMLN